MTAFPAAVPTWTADVVVDGQSLVDTSSTPGTRMWRNLAYLLPATIPVNEVAVGGMSWQSLLNGQVSPPCDPAVDRWGAVWRETSANHVLVMYGGQNNLTQTGAEIYDACGDYADAARSFGFDVVVCLWIPPIGAIWGDFTAILADFNELIDDDPDGHFDAAIPDIPAITQALATAWPNPTYIDGVHQDYAGNRATAVAVEAVVSPLL